jgi:uncharacterized membrane-anchored protein
MTTQPPEKKKELLGSAGRQIKTSLQVGCLTFLVAGIALAIGFWLDARLGTFPSWTLILVLGSAPLALFGVFWMVRRSLKRSSGEHDANDQA